MQPGSLVAAAKPVRQAQGEARTLCYPSVLVRLVSRAEFECGTMQLRQTWMAAVIKSRQRRDSPKRVSRLRLSCIVRTAGEGGPIAVAPKAQSLGKERALLILHRRIAVPSYDYRKLISPHTNSRQRAWGPRGVADATPSIRLGIRLFLAIFVFVCWGGSCVISTSHSNRSRR